MKSLCCLATSLLMSMSAQASQTDATPDPVGRWLHQRAMQAAMQEASMTRGSSVGAGSYQIVRLAELDAPEEVKHQLRTDMDRSAGVVLVADCLLYTSDAADE